jgi:hypothetical protein
MAWLLLGRITIGSKRRVSAPSCAAARHPFLSADHRPHPQDRVIAFVHQRGIREGVIGARAWLRTCRPVHRAGNPCRRSKP